MATLAPSSASARALAAPMPREPPVTRATFPVRVLVIAFLRRSNSDQLWIRTGGADPAGISCSLSRRRGRPASERCHGRLDRRRFRCGPADREPAGFLADRAAAVRDAAPYRSLARLPQAPRPADASDAPRAA